MSSVRSTVFSALADWIQDKLTTAYGADSKCVRVIGQNPESTLPENTPKCWSLEGPSELVWSDQHPHHRAVQGLLFFLYRISSTNQPVEATDEESPVVQNVLDDIEDMLTPLFLITILGGHAVHIELRGQIDSSAGGTGGWLEVPIVVRMPILYDGPQ